MFSHTAQRIVKERMNNEGGGRKGVDMCMYCQQIVD